MKSGKPNVLLFIKLPPPFTGSTYMNEVVNSSHLLRKNFRIDTLGITYSKSIKQLGSISIKKILVFTRVIIILIQKIAIFRPKLIYFQISPLGTAFYRDLIYATVMKIFKKKIVFHLHGKGIRELSERSAFRRALYKFCFKNEFIICLSEYIIDDISEVYNGRPFILNNCIKSPDDTNPAKEINSREYFTLLMISNLHESKGIFDYLELIKDLAKEYPNIKGLLIGAEGRTKVVELLNHINRLGINDHFEYVGPKYGAEKIVEIRQADILIHPTKNEAWGLVILEAMALGLPVISTKEGSIPVMIKNGYNGYLVEKGDVKKMFEHVSSLINDPAKKRELGKNSKKIFESRFTCEIFEENLVGIFNEIFNHYEPTHPAT